MDYDQANRLMERDVIEVAPLAFMRGRTLNDSFIILDEAQNTTSDQMKMFLTRLGFDSRVVITGDITQVDLPLYQPSGLILAREILSGVSGIAFCEFSELDVVRHPIVQEVIRAYECYERKKRGESIRESLHVEQK
jgi:phosphate starvation-inducible PhoH-like protein